MPLFSQYCKSKSRLEGKTVVITGANTGIGKETAWNLYRRGARVIMACRDLVKAQAALEDVKKTLPSKPNKEEFKGEPGELVIQKLDLNSLDSVRECAKKILETEPAIHILINNAGVMMCPKGVTEDGFETQLGTNHLGHFLFTLLLLPMIIQSRKDSDPCCRIINVSSLAHRLSTGINFNDLMSEKSYGAISAYCQSKLANVLFTRELAHRLKEANIKGVNTYSLHPGVIKSELSRHLDDSFFRGVRFLYSLVGFMIKTVEQGAQTTLHCALDEQAANETGLYYRECAAVSPSSSAMNKEMAARLWDESVKLVGLPTNDLTELIEKIPTEYVR
ncbi:retinol dehydrogenase 11-like [Neodiprion pinetum]|uniref:retinol dehydrogenase 11-like n=1 Tax=Neodiprion pinetum TaxID=441929 RepID=UPI001EDE46FC|nr:retinol dehydrogenase 11-like [Neodiprion pinetum]